MTGFQLASEVRSEWRARAPPSHGRRPRRDSEPSEGLGCGFSAGEPRPGLLARASHPLHWRLGSARIQQPATGSEA
jgi:hypothetical protein